MSNAAEIRKLIEAIERVNAEPIEEGLFDMFKRNKQEPVKQEQQAGSTNTSSNIPVKSQETTDPLISQWKSLSTTLNNALQSLKAGKLQSVFHGQELQKMPDILERSLTLGQKAVIARQRNEHAAFINLARQLGSTLSQLATMRQQGFNKVDVKLDQHVLDDAKKFKDALTNILKQAGPFIKVLRASIETARNV